MNENLLKCQVFPGMFSDELAVRYPRSGATTTYVNSFFVPREKVVGLVGDSGPAQLKVQVLREGGTAWAVIPSETQPAIVVDDADLSAV